MKEYSFFSYEINEALHLSDLERQTIIDCFSDLETELKHSIDKHSKTLIVNILELLLNHCIRFYERQFITRSHSNSDILGRFENILNDYFKSDEPQKHGLPTVKYFAHNLNISAIQSETLF